MTSFPCFLLQDGDFETVKSLMSGLQAFGDVSRYSATLFDCVDHKQTEIAKYLITNGFKTDIYKQVRSPPLKLAGKLNVSSFLLREVCFVKIFKQVIGWLLFYV